MRFSFPEYEQMLKRGDVVMDIAPDGEFVCFYKGKTYDYHIDGIDQSIRLRRIREENIL